MQTQLSRLVKPFGLARPRAPHLVARRARPTTRCDMTDSWDSQLARRVGDDPTAFAALTASLGPASFIRTANAIRRVGDAVERSNLAHVAAQRGGQAGDAVLAKLLWDPSHLVRCTATAASRDRRTSRTLQAFVKRLPEEPSPWMRAMMAALLIGNGTAAVRCGYPPSRLVSSDSPVHFCRVPLLTDPSPVVRQAAAWASRPLQRGARDLRALLRDHDSWVRTAAVLRLAGAPQPEDHLVAVHAAGMTHLFLLEAARRAPGKLGALRNGVKALPRNDRAMAHRVLDRFRGWRWPFAGLEDATLKTALQHGTRLDAADVSRAQEIVACPRSDDAERTVMGRALLAYAGRDKETRAWLYAWLLHVWKPVEVASALRAVTVPLPQCLPLVRALHEQHDSYCHEIAGYLLMRGGWQGAAGVLAARAAGADHDDLHRLAHHLGVLGGPDAVQVLPRLRRHPHPTVRREADVGWLRLNWMLQQPGTI